MQPKGPRRSAEGPEFQTPFCHQPQTKNHPLSAPILPHKKSEGLNGVSRLPLIL